MGADATLVNMAYRAAMAKSPGDWSASFDKQYEGIIAANKAMTFGLGRAFAGAIGEMAGAYTERRKQEMPGEQAILAAQELEKYKSDAGSTLLKNAAATNTYENGEGLNPAFREAAYSVPTDIYNKITKINKKVFKTKKDKQIVAEQYARLESWKKDRIQEKAWVKWVVGLTNSDGVNMENMKPEFKALMAQLINNKDDLSSKGIKIYNRKSDDKLMVEFTPNRMENEAEYNKRMKEVDGGPSVYQTQPVAPYQGSSAEGLTYVEQKAGLQTVSFEDLINNITPRELELQNDVYEGVTSFHNIAGERDKNGVFKTSAWDDGSVNSGKAKATKMIRNMFSGKTQKHVADLATTDFFGTGRTYRGDLTGLVGGMDLGALDVEDKGEPGYEDDMKNSLLREEIVGRLINPQTPSDLKFAREEMENYYIGMAEGVFSKKRTADLAAEEAARIAKGKTKKTAKTGKQSLGLGRTEGMENTQIWKDTAEIKAVYDNIVSLGKGKKLGIIQGWDGAHTYQFRKVPNSSKWNYQVWDANGQRFITQAVGGKTQISTDNVIREMAIPTTISGVYYG